MRAKQLIRIFLPLMVLGYMASYRLLNLPSNRDIIVRYTNFVDSHGVTASYGVLAVSAFAEAIIGVGLYYPGSVILVVGASLCADGSLQLPVFILSTWAGFVLAYSFDYASGRLGWYHVLVRLGHDAPLARAEQSIQRLSVRQQYLLMGMSYVFPNVAAIWSTAAGMMRLPVRRFLGISIVASAAWTTFWAIAAYMLSDLVMTAITTWMLIPLLLLSVVIVYVDPARLRGLLRRLQWRI